MSEKADEVYTWENSLFCQHSLNYVNRKRVSQGKPPLPPEPWVGREVSWSHQANGKTYFFSGDIVDVFYPDDDHADFHRNWLRFKSRYGRGDAQGKSRHPRVVVRLDNGKGYRFPPMNRITFRDSTTQQPCKPS